MHHKITVKVKGSSLESASNQVKEVMEDSLCCSECYKSVSNVNWDYVGGIQHLKEAYIPFKGERKKATFKNMVKYLEKDRDVELKRAEDTLRGYLNNWTIPQYMTKRSAPLYIKGTWSERAAEVLKSGGPDKRYPGTPEELTEAIYEAVSSDSLLPFYLREVEALRNIQKYGEADDSLYTLHCANNYYADLTKITFGPKVYYFKVDRHH